MRSPRDKLCVFSLAVALLLTPLLPRHLQHQNLPHRRLHRMGRLVHRMGRLLHLRSLLRMGRLLHMHRLNLRRLLHMRRLVNHRDHVGQFSRLCLCLLLLLLQLSFLLRLPFLLLNPLLIGVVTLLASLQRARLNGGGIVKSDGAAFVHSELAIGSRNGSRKDSDTGERKGDEGVERNSHDCGLD
ncbi:hypothetical protein BZA05DRAFT_388096 [Tricharina praecox]|uniref:uncharacterized protein n=1 Tax=Tricharina praecox TaxID=43433 RepID=UPI00221EDB5A|nr:uncharacterized protein BZA05DRAFT_388096 [Tricharina praecox]KAI5856322.1 hypothetical protein BZA05DRAFT_388096 [Tricharina praecox]